MTILDKGCMWNKRKTREKIDGCGEGGHAKGLCDRGGC